MRVLEITASLSRRVNLGNYEHEDRFLAIKISPETGDERIHDLVLVLFKNLEDEVRSSLPKGIYGKAEDEYLARKAAMAATRERQEGIP